MSTEAIGMELSSEREAAFGMVSELWRLLITWIRVMILYGLDFDHYTCNTVMLIKNIETTVLHAKNKGRMNLNGLLKFVLVKRVCSAYRVCTGLDLQSYKL